MLFHSSTVTSTPVRISYCLTSSTERLLLALTGALLGATACTVGVNEVMPIYILYINSNIKLRNLDAKLPQPNNALNKTDEFLR